MGSPDPESVRIEVPRAMAGVRLDRALADLLPGYSRAQVQKLVRRGGVKLDGRKVVRSNLDLRGGEVVVVRVPGDSTGAGAPGPGLVLVHLEPDLAVVNKPAGVLTHPIGPGRGDSVSELAVRELGLLPTVEGEDRPGIVHRLDRETSGLMVLARRPEVLEELRRQFRERTVEKRYLAIVHGVPSQDRFRVERALGPVPGNKDLQRMDASGRAAVTDFRVVQRAAGFARVECRPTTGRRHQLRVHLLSVGHPIVGDKLYRPRNSAERVRGVAYHALHAEALAFDRPADGQRLEFEIPPPASFEGVWKRVSRP